MGNNFCRRHNRYVEDNTIKHYKSHGVDNLSLEELYLKEWIKVIIESISLPANPSKFMISEAKPNSNSTTKEKQNSNSPIEEKLIYFENTRVFYGNGKKYRIGQFKLELDGYFTRVFCDLDDHHYRDDEDRERIEGTSQDIYVKRMISIPYSKRFLVFNNRGESEECDVKFIGASFYDNWNEVDDMESRYYYSDIHESEELMQFTVVRFTRAYKKRIRNVIIESTKMLGINLPVGIINFCILPFIFPCPYNIKEL